MTRKRKDPALGQYLLQTEGHDETRQARIHCCLRRFCCCWNYCSAVFRSRCDAAALDATNAKMFACDASPSYLALNERDATSTIVQRCYELVMPQSLAGPGSVCLGYSYRLESASNLEWLTDPPRIMTPNLNSIAAGGANSRDFSTSGGVSHRNGGRLHNRLPDRKMAVQRASLACA